MLISLIVPTLLLPTIFLKVNLLHKNNKQGHVWKILSLLHKYPFRAFLVGKSIEAIGDHCNSKFLRNAGFAISIPTSYLLSQNCKVEIPRSIVINYPTLEITTFYSTLYFSKASHGFLINISPYKTLYAITKNGNVTENLWNASVRGFQWGTIRLIEVVLKDKVPDRFQQLKIAPWPWTKILSFYAVFGNEHIKITKTLFRESFEEVMSVAWKEECDRSLYQTPFVVANMLYPYSLDPTFECLNKTFNFLLGAHDIETFTP